MSRRRIKSRRAELRDTVGELRQDMEGRLARKARALARREKYYRDETARIYEPDQHPRHD